MKLLKVIKQITTKTEAKQRVVKDQLQQLLIEQGKEEFTKLLDRGIQVPVALL